MKWFSDEVKERLKWRWEFARRSKEMKGMILQEASYGLPISEEDLTLLSEIYFHFDVMENLGAISVLYPKKPKDEPCYEYYSTGMDLYKEYMIISRGGDLLKELKREGTRPSITTVHRSTPIILDDVHGRHNSIVIDINLDRKKEDIHKDIDLLLEVLKMEAKQRKRKPWHLPKRPQFDIYERMIKVYDLKKENPKMHWSEIAKIVFPDQVYSATAYKRKPRQEKIGTASAINKVMRDAKEAKKMIEGGWRQI